jgi:hypothetical protein
MCAELKITIPWHSLKNEPIIIELKDVSFAIRERVIPKKRVFNKEVEKVFGKKYDNIFHYTYIFLLLN